MGDRDRSALPELDETFHAVYDRLRDATKHRGVVLVVAGETIFVFRGEERRELSIASAAADVLKRAAHVPVGVFLVARRLVDQEALDEDARRELRRLLRLCQARSDGSAPLDAALATALRETLDRCVALLVSTLEAGRVDDAARVAFAKDLGPRLLHLAEAATQRQLAALHEAAQLALGRLTAAERDELHVVVAGAHQARVRSLPMQYFQKLLHEPPGVEERVFFAEAVTDPEQARALVGTNLLDREIATAFFGDPRRLQRDVLGDMARHLLEGALEPAPTETT